LCPGSGFASTQYPTSAIDVAQNSSPAGDFSVQATYKLHKVFPRMYLSGGTDQLDNCPCAGVLITNAIENSDPIFIGGIGDDNAYVNRAYQGDNHGHILYPGQSWVDPVGNSNLVTIAGTKNSLVFISAFLNQPTDVQLDTSTPPQPDPPVLLSSTPTNGTVAVSNNSGSFTALFNVALDPSTVTTQNITISPAVVGMTVAVDGTNPAQVDISGLVGNLAQNTKYTITFLTGGLASADLGFVTTGIQTITFTTDLAPVLDTSTPINNAVAVGNISQFIANTSQPLLSSSITTGNISISPSVTGFAVRVDPTDNSQVLMSATALSLTANTTYTITLGTGVSSANGYTLVGPISFSFTTDIAPSILTPFPVSAGTNIDINTQIFAVANRTIDPATLNGTNITVTGGTTGTLTFNIDNANTSQIDIRHASNLANSTTYTVTINVGVASVLGFGLSALFTWSFTTTAAAPPNVAPTVIAVFPLNNATGIIPLAASIQLQLVFSENMDGTTINNTNITLKTTAGSVNAPCTVTLGGDNITVTMVPSSDLTASTQYTITVTTAVKSAVAIGNLALGSTFTSTFTTEARPTVFAVSPLNAATGVDLAVHPTITFSTGMKLSTIITANIFITGVTSTLATTTDSQGRTVVTITPNANLANNTGFTLNATSSCQQADGYALASSFTSTFTTANFAPTVTTTSPIAGLTAVPITTHPSITFSKQMKSSTITTSNVFLNPGPVAATIAYNAGTFVATITPNSSLANNTTYTITVTTSVQENQYSIPITSQFTSTFTTVSATPTVTSTSPVNGTANVSVNTDPTITFSIPMKSSSITTSTCYITDPSNNIQPATVTLNSNVVTINTTNVLNYSTVYTIHATTGCQSSGSVALGADFTASFTTIALSYTKQYNISEGSTRAGSISNSYYLGSTNGYYAFGEQADVSQSAQKMVGFIITKVQVADINIHSGSLSGSSLNVEIRDQNGVLKYAYNSSSAISLTSFTSGNTPATPPIIIDSTNTYQMADKDVLLVRWLSPPGGADLEISKATSSVYNKAIFAKYSSSGNGTWTSYTAKTGDDFAGTMYSTP
jgi:hypothetical protein